MKEINIAIVGGGIAGLTMAYLLINKISLENIKLNITLFEATNRIGGRIYTWRDFDEELYAELGAISIGDNEHDILNLINELNIKLIARPDREKKRYFAEGQWQIKTDITSIMIFIIQEVDRLQKTGIIMEEKDWISKEIHKKTILDHLNKIPITEFLLKAMEENKLTLEHPDKLQDSIGASLLGLYARKIKKLSAFDALRFMSQYQNTQCVYSIVEGNDVLTTTLYKTISNNCNVLFKAAVYQIKEMENNQLIVSVKHDNQKKKFQFDAVILAVPLSSLQPYNQNHIKFKPSLPPKKQEAINKIVYNQNVARVYFEVKSRFWLEDHIDTAMVITDKITAWIEDHTAHLFNKQHAVLEAHTSNLIGKKIIESDQPGNLGKEQISYVYGNKFDEACLHKQPTTFFWSKQPYQQGANANLETDQKKYLKEMGTKVGNKFFIGDYTSIGCPASINGAVRSTFKVFDQLKQKLETDSLMIAKTQPG